MNRLKVIDRFDYAELQEDFRATMIAPSKSGKTEFLLHLLSEIVRWYPYIFLVVPCVNDKYARYVWPNHMFIVESIQQINEVLETILTFAAKQTKVGRKKKILVITDDLGMMTADKTCKIDRLLLRGRGIGISLIVLAQSYQMISPNMRNNITHTFLFSITDDFTHYIRNIPKNETSAEIMTRIKSLFTKLLNRSEPGDTTMGRQTRYVVVIACKSGGSMEISYSFIKNYDELYKRNILSLQQSRMKEHQSPVTQGDQLLV